MFVGSYWRGCEFSVFIFCGEDSEDAFVKYALFYEVLEGFAWFKTAIKLDVRVFPEKGTLGNLVLNPLLNDMVSDSLKGVHIGSVRVLDMS